MPSASRSSGREAFSEADEPLSGGIHEPYGALGGVPSDTGSGDEDQDEKLQHSPFSDNASSYEAATDREALRESSNAEPYKPHFVSRGRKSQLLRRPPQPFKQSTSGSFDTEAAHRDPPPPFVQYSRDVSKDGITIMRVFWSIPCLIEPFYFAVRVALLVTFPLCVLAFHPNTKAHFVAGSLLPVVGTANTQLVMGQQIAGSIVMYQTAVFAMLYGTFCAAIGAVHHENAWWGLTFGTIVLLSFFSVFRSKKLMMLYGVVVMQMQKTSVGKDIDFSAKFASNIILGVTFAMAQSFLPFPTLMTRKTDREFGTAWRSVASIAQQLRRGVWSGRAYSSSMVTSEGDCDALEALIDSFPGKLFFCSYEPIEGSLNNQLRNIRLVLLKRLMLIIQGATAAGNSVNGMVTAESRASIDEWKAILRHPLDNYLNSLEETLAEMARTLSPGSTVTKCPFADLEDKKNALRRALAQLRDDVTHKDPAEVDAPLFYSFLYFHMLLCLLAEELHSFADTMENFDASHLKSTLQRMWEFFILDFVHEFRYTLLDRFLLKSPADVRDLKEGIRLACAFTAAAVFTEQLNSDSSADTYFFGMSIILGIGLPTAAESIEVGVQRVCGMAFSIAIGYIAEWKTNTFPQTMAVIICFSFLATFFRDNKRYMHVAFYTSFIAPAAYGIAHDKITMLARVVDNSFACVAYFAICTFMFPVNPYRVLWNRYVVIFKKCADTITLLSSATQHSSSWEAHDIVTAKLDLATSAIQTVLRAIGDTASWIPICAKQPHVIGVDFPTEQVARMQVRLQHIGAGLGIWLFGLQLLHREREKPPHRIIARMIATLSPIAVEMEAYSRRVFQDFIDALENTEGWTLEGTLGHFNDFVMLKGRLDYVFHLLHKDMVMANHMRLRRLATQAHMGHDSGRGANPIGNNLSFVTHSLLQVDPSFFRVVPDIHHVYETRGDAREQHQMDDLEPAAVSPSRAADNSTGVVVAPSPHMVLSPRAAPQINTSFSFRAMDTDMPVDIDITASTIILTSTSTLISSLEVLLPIIKPMNRFTNSRNTVPTVTFKSFYMCD